MRTDFLETQEEVHNAVVVTPPPANIPIKFDVTTAAIADMKAKADSLTIAGPDDKVGFKAVYETRQAVKDQRIAVQNRQKALKRPHIDYNRDVDAAADLLIEPMKQIEDKLALQEKAYNDERDRIAEEKAKVARIRYEGRLDALRKAGFAYNVEFDTYESGEVIINVDDIRDLSDDEYTPTAAIITDTYQKELARVAEAKRVQDAETARIAAEQKAELDRQEAERKRLIEQAAELQKKSDELDALTLKNRITALLNVGFVEDGRNYTSPSGNSFIRPKSILLLTDAQFLILIEETIAGNKKREADRIQAEKDEADRIKAEKLAEQERKKADREREKLAKPDRKQLKDFFLTAKVMGSHPKALNLPESQDLYGNFWSQYSTLISDNLKLVDAL